MKKISLAALVISASIGGQVLSAAADGNIKVGALSFALSDTFQYRVYQNGQLTSNTVPYLANCDGNVRYETQTERIDNRRIIAAIGKALGATFTTRAQLVIGNYDNYIPGPPYPPYLVNPPPDTFNGPRDNSYRDIIVAMEDWPNEVQIDWVDYDYQYDSSYTVPYDRWPKALVFISDPYNGNSDFQCVDVSAFWSFEEAYCYFCWDTVDRVTKGTLANSMITIHGDPGDYCIGGGTPDEEVCTGVQGSGTTRWYMTIKFNNDFNSNGWLYRDDNLRYWLRNVSARDRLIFTVGGVVTYSWKMRTLDGVGSAYGTMSMSEPTGYGLNPWCGVLTGGSIKITETTDARIPVCYYDNNGD